MQVCGAVIFIERVTESAHSPYLLERACRPIVREHRERRIEFVDDAHNLPQRVECVVMRAYTRLQFGIGQCPESSIPLSQSSCQSVSRSGTYTTRSRRTRASVIGEREHYELVR